MSFLEFLDYHLIIGLLAIHLWCSGMDLYDLDQFLKKMRPQVTHMMAFEEYDKPLPKWWLVIFFGTMIWGLGLFYPFSINSTKYMERRDNR